MVDLKFNGAVMNFEDSGNASPLAGRSRPVRGILKVRSSPRGKAVKFDEANLDLNIRERPAERMKIDEPKTPFHYPNSDDGDDDLEMMDLADNENDDECKVPTTRATPSIMQSAAIRITESALNRRHEWETSESEDAESMHAVPDRDRDFRARRRQHYNEFEAVKRFREAHAKDDDDDE